ncbi:hypothetical protein RB195_010767 [Necator americanus]|uniref:Uncharacterized protein n=1 Tax=Necator americanus TaxID=51031 RepID=A0ABR1D0M6_NECAM
MLSPQLDELNLNDQALSLFGFTEKECGISRYEKKAVAGVAKETQAHLLACLIEEKKEREAKLPKVAHDVKLRRIDSVWGGDNACSASELTTVSV